MNIYLNICTNNKNYDAKFNDIMSLCIVINNLTHLTLNLNEPNTDYQQVYTFI